MLDPRRFVRDQPLFAARQIAHTAQRARRQHVEIEHDDIGGTEQTRWLSARVARYGPSAPKSISASQFGIWDGLTERERRRKRRRRKQREAA